MSSTKIHAGDSFPSLPVQNLDGETIDIAKPSGSADWQMVVVYRGQHCPLCTKYLNALDGYLERLKEADVSVAAVSADSEDQLTHHLERLDTRVPLYFGLTLEQMQSLGLYVSVPRSEKETDHLFPEPGLFVINAEGNVQVVDLSNNPFVRPELDALVSGIEWIRDPDNNYPIRGTHRL
ncbi:MAG: redoxin domain-containing protein [Pseudomonadota bacterium]